MTSLDVTVHDGPAGAPTVILVHGALDRSANFARVAAALPELRVVRYTRRGYDGSGPPGGVDVDVHVADLLTLLDRPSVLIGHSYGALVALGAAVHEPALVPALGVFEPPLPWEPWWPPRFQFDDPTTAAEVFFRAVVGHDAWDRLPDRFRQARVADGPALMADVGSAVGGLAFDFTDVLSPVAAAYGSETTEAFRRSAETVAADCVHGARLSVIDGAAHGAHLTHPEEFADWVRSVVAMA